VNVLVSTRKYTNEFVELIPEKDITFSLIIDRW